MSTNGEQAVLPLWEPPLRHPFRLRVNDYVRIDGKLGRVIRVTESAAVVLVNQPPRRIHDAVRQARPVPSRRPSLSDSFNSRSTF